VGTIGLGDAQSRSKDILGRFAEAEGKRGGQFYTARCVVQLLVAMLEPYRGRVYDPCCGSGGMFVQSERFVEAHGGRIGDISIYGQESNPTTWRLCKMNLAIRGIEGNIGPNNADSFLNDLHKDLRADFILANPPFNMKAWGGEQLQKDVRWRYGVPPNRNANYAWVQHMIHHLAPSGMLGLVLANGSMSSNTSNEGQIRRAIVEADLIDCMVALPGQLFYTTGIPVCLWFLAKNKSALPSPAGRGVGGEGFRDRRGETLFIDARQMGEMIDRTHRELSEEDIDKIAGTYHAWRGEPEAGEYENVPGFCKSATLDEIRGHEQILTPGRYVGILDLDDDDEPFEERMERLTAELREQFQEAQRLQKAIETALSELA
jgi:type I restriction enzyme M protein